MLDNLLIKLKDVVLHSFQKALNLIGESPQLIKVIEATRSEVAAILLGGMAFYHLRESLQRAEGYADKALSLSREIHSNTAEVWALFIKGQINEFRGDHKRATAWYTKALDKCPDPLRPGMLCALGASFGKQGDYGRALSNLNKAIEQVETFIKNNEYSGKEKLILKFILTEAWSQLGNVNKSIGDFEESRKNFDEALKLARENQFHWEICMTLLRKSGLMLMMGKPEEADIYLNEVEGMPIEEVDSKLQLYTAHSRARQILKSRRYEEALAKYRMVVYGKSDNNIKMDQHLDNLLDHQADMLGEILSGISECLQEMGGEKVYISENLRSVNIAYERVLLEAGIFKQIDKESELRILMEKIRNILWQIFERMPLRHPYKHIIIKHDLAQGKASYAFIRNDEEFPLEMRAFLIFKTLYENLDKCVTRKELERIWNEQKVGAGGFGKPNETGVGTYIMRLRDELKLREFLITCPRPKGWKLIP